MTLYKCDGCGLISPDEKGNHISNHWFEVEISNRTLKPHRNYYLLCPDCMGVKLPKKFWDKVKDFFK